MASKIGGTPGIAWIANAVGLTSDTCLGYATIAGFARRHPNERVLQRDARSAAFEKDRGGNQGHRALTEPSVEIGAKEARCESGAAGQMIGFVRLNFDAFGRDPLSWPVLVESLL